MLARYVQKGDAIDYRPAEAVAAGDVVIIADLIGIARLDIEAFFGKKVFLNLYVKVLKDWRNKDSELKNFGYANK